MKCNSFLNQVVQKNFLLFITIFLVACNSASTDSDYIDENGYTDGVYCAQVDYYNPNTGTSSSYTLNVDVQSNEVITIHWGNGGWLDEDHFDPVELNADGTCSFTSDKGYEYEIRILGEKCNSTEESSFQNNLRREQESTTCKNCGFEKDAFDDYCEDCQDKIDRTCERCGKYDSHMYSSDQFCTECKDELENTCSRCGKHQYYVFGGLCNDCEEMEN